MVLHHKASGGFGAKVKTVASGIGTIKAGIDIGRALWGFGSAVAPYAAALI